MRTVEGPAINCAAGVGDHRAGLGDNDESGRFNRRTQASGWVSRMLKVATIGVYGFDSDFFLQELRDAGVRLLLDVRQRRGVRGPEYAWANSRRLQAALAEAGIGYEHHPELAPTTELRQLQYSEDARHGVGQRSRQQLSAEFAHRYTTEILDHADLTPIVAALSRGGLAALLCVERDPEACHRSLIAQRLAEQHRVKVTHLRPS